MTHSDEPSHAKLQGLLTRLRRDGIVQGDEAEADGVVAVKHIKHSDQTRLEKLQGLLARLRRGENVQNRQLDTRNNRGFGDVIGRDAA